MDWSEGEKPKDCEADFVLNPRRREAARREQAKRDKIRVLKSWSRRTGDRGGKKAVWPLAKGVFCGAVRSVPLRRDGKRDKEIIRGRRQQPAASFYMQGFSGSVRHTVLFLRPSKKFFDIEKCIIMQEYFHNLPFWSGERTERAATENNFGRIHRL